MLPPFIIEQIRRREEREAEHRRRESEERPRLEIPIDVNQPAPTLPEDEEDDDNPNEYRYLGYGDARAIWTPNRNTFTLMVRPGTEGTGVEATWSYPLTRILRAYVQYYDGYGESLLDYDHQVRRIGLGVALSDYLQR